MVENEREEQKHSEKGSMVCERVQNLLGESKQRASKGNAEEQWQRGDHVEAQETERGSSVMSATVSFFGANSRLTPPVMHSCTRFET